MSIKSSQKSSEISVRKLRRAYKTKDLLNLSVRAKGIEYFFHFLNTMYVSERDQSDDVLQKHSATEHIK